MYLTIGTSLVNQVDGLVRQKTLVDILGAGTHSKVEGLVGIIHTMKLLVVLFQLFQDF